MYSVASRNSEYLRYFLWHPRRGRAAGAYDAGWRSANLKALARGEAVAGLGMRLFGAARLRQRSLRFNGLCRADGPAWAQTPYRGY